MKKLRTRLAAFVIASLTAALPFVVACSNNAEGERCDQASDNGGNDDCQDGLICTPKSDLGTSSDLCCPADRTQATTPQCGVSHAPVGGDAGLPATDSGGTTDTGAPDTGTKDASDAGSTDTGTTTDANDGSTSSDAAEGG